MPRRKPRRKRSTHATKRLWAVAASVAALILLIGGAYRSIETRMVPILRQEWRGRRATRIFSAPRRLQKGEALSRRELLGRLKRLQYRSTPEQTLTPGEFLEEAASIRVYTRTFEHLHTKTPAMDARITIEHGRISRMASSITGEIFDEILLEPELLYEISGPKRIRREPLNFARVPPRLLQALVAIEDRRFYDHYGIDLRAITRAAWRNIRAGRIKEGGSTLTQQLARNLFLTPERTFSRKVKEALLALYLEIRLSKEDILKTYLDSAYFGQIGPVSIIGLTAAAKHFFGASPQELTLSQSALLAGLLKSPNGYSPIAHPDKAIRRRNIVLAAMHQANYIAADQEKHARREPLILSPNSLRRPHASDYFLAHIRTILEKRYADEALFTRGLTIHTTLDPWMQERAHASIRRAKHQAALVALDPRSGAIRALVGGKDYLRSPFNRATQAKRQPGSAFKPFIYGAALQTPRNEKKPWTPSSLISDTTREFKIDGGTWIPRNYSRKYNGPVPLRTALALSLNAASVNLAAQISPQRVIAFARTLGITSPLRPELGIALGTFEVSLLELTGAYCAFGNGGYRVDPHGIETALDSEGHVLETRSPEPTSVLSPGQAYLMTSMLREAVLEGTAHGLSRWSLEKVSAGKTGTTNDGKDAWFIGYTPWITVGVWTGSDQPEKLGITGAGEALPLWAHFIRSIRPLETLKNKTDSWTAPEDILRIEIDPASGLRAQSGCPYPRSELFISGTEPDAYCPVHSGGIVGWFKNIFRPKKRSSYR